MTFPVSESKHKQLAALMQRLGVAESDFEEHFVRSSGAGGQHVNKTSSCVWLRHRPSGTEVKCQISRSQALNRFLARRLLLEKLETKVLGEKSAARQQIEKIRRQKRKRSKRAKEKMLQDKKHQSYIKKMRKPGLSMD